jgi:hypothetical protein
VTESASVTPTVPSALSTRRPPSELTWSCVSYRNPLLARAPVTVIFPRCAVAVLVRLVGTVIRAPTSARPRRSADNRITTTPSGAVAKYARV